MNPKTIPAYSRRTSRKKFWSFFLCCVIPMLFAQQPLKIGDERAISCHLRDGQEFQLSPTELIDYGKRLFEARFTSEDGAGRPLTKGTGAPLSSPNQPLVFPRNINRISGPDSNSCAGCHNEPVAGGAGDLSTNVFVMGQRFDFVTFGTTDRNGSGSAFDERQKLTTLQSIANSRSTPELFGVGYYEMVARQITTDLQSLRYRLQPGQSVKLISKGISFGVLSRNADGTWNTTNVRGLPRKSLISEGSSYAPSLTILPFHQNGQTVSLRVFTVDSFNQHHGMQATERFGIGTDPDGDGVIDELTRADITAVTVFQATLPVPTQIMPDNPNLRAAAQRGGESFRKIGCASCHIPSLPLVAGRWIFTEPNPQNMGGNLEAGQAPVFSIDLTNDELPQPRLKPINGVVDVPLYTDFQLHDLCKDKNDPNRELLDANESIGSPRFFEGNGKFLTRRLWAVGSKPNFFHHGQFTTIREAILNHYGEAFSTRQAFWALSSYEQGAVVEFLKSLKSPGDQRKR